MGHRTAVEGHRVLVCAPFGRDAESVVRLLSEQGYDALPCPDIAMVAAELDEHVGVVLLTEEALRGETRAMAAAIARQPAWSDIPFVILAGHNQRGRDAVLAIRTRVDDFTGNAIVLERPLSLASLISATASAMRSRQRQFDLRDRLAELERGREALAVSEAELRIVADVIPMLVAFVDRDGIYRFVNRAAEDWLERSPQDVIGRHISEIAGDRYPERAGVIEQALAGIATHEEVSVPQPDGQRREAEVRLLPRRDAAGNVDGFHIFALDITDRKRTEQELEQRVAERTAALEVEMANREQMEAALRQSQKMEAVGQLTGGIAHDFNNMLTGVIGAMDIMKRRLAAGRYDDLGRFMDAAATSAERAAGLTARLLAFSRRQSLDSQPVDTSALVQSLDDLLRRTIHENIALDIVTEADLPRAIVDANQLESAILNLSINARDAMPNGGQLTIEIRLATIDAETAHRQDIGPGRYVVISVTDTGVGMTPEVLEKVFDPFFTTKPIGQGTGLGLSMVYGFARQSSGQVRVHSQPGIGTTVAIYLPTADHGTDAQADQPAAPTREGSGQNVLLVEDDDSVRLLVREVLNELSYVAIEADKAEDAILVLQSDRPIHLMISDVGLPGMNGRQLAEIARRHRPDLPILFVTGYAENAAIRAGFLGTNMAMITKPFSIDILAGKVADMIGKGPIKASLQNSA